MASPFILPDTMSPYDREAWLTAIQDMWGKKIHLGNLSQSSPKQLITPISGNAEVAKIKETNAIQASTASIEVAVGKALVGLKGFTVERGLYSVTPKTTLRRLKKRGYEVENLDDVRELPLEVVEYGFHSKKKYRYQLAGLAQGAAASFATTGLSTLTTLSGGATAGIAIGAIAFDAVSVTASIGRMIGSVAASYGYDVHKPNEGLYASRVLEYCVLNANDDINDKICALKNLATLSQNMMQNTSMQQLQQEAAVKLINQIFKAVGVRLTKKKLAGYIPVAGIAINAGLGVKLASDTMERAHQVYRLRFLSEQYGLDTDLWTTQFEVLEDTDTEEIEDAILIDEMFDEAIAEQTAVEEPEA